MSRIDPNFLKEASAALRTIVDDETAADLERRLEFLLAAND